MKEDLRKKNADILMEISIFVALAFENKTIDKLKQKQK